MAAVQHGSTATHPDAGGLAGTREDGDLHGWTRVDVAAPSERGRTRVSGAAKTGSWWRPPTAHRSWRWTSHQRRECGTKPLRSSTREIHTRLVSWWLVHAWRGVDPLEDTPDRKSRV